MKKGFIALACILLMTALIGCNSKGVKEQEQVNLEEKKENEVTEVEESSTDVVSPEKEQEEVVEPKKENESSKEDVKEAVKEPVKEPEPINYQEVQPNEIGTIFVVMYHGILDNPPYHRTEEDFLKDLNYMYENGYRPISIEDYVNNNITVEAGLTPIVLTFDDGLSTTFSMIRDDNGKLIPKPGTAVAIMEKFTEDHPDFGKAATFYINGDDAFGEGEGTYEERLNWLVDNGYSLGNHTATHADLASSSPDRIKKELATIVGKINKVLPEYPVNTLAYPFGQRPTDYPELIVEGEADGQQYKNLLAFRVGYSAPYVGPNHVQFQPYNHPRVTASEGYDWDLWFAFDYYEKNTYLRYVSDGNPNTIAVKKTLEERVNKDSLGDKELILYEVE